MAYISTAEANTYLGTSWEDTLISVLITSAEIILNNLLWTNDLTQATHTEKIQYPWYTWNYWLNYWRVFWLNNINPTSITSIDWVNVTNNVDYILEWRKVILKTALTYQNTFPYKNTIIYVAWFSPIPNDIKQGMYMLVWALYNQRKAEWITRFKQAQLEVEYKPTTSLDNILDPKDMWLLNSIVNKYKITTILSSGINRVITPWSYPLW